MAKSSKQAAGNKQGGNSNKSGSDFAKTGNPASNTNPASTTAATGNAQLVKAQPDTAMAEAMAGLPQLPATDPAGRARSLPSSRTIVASKDCSRSSKRRRRNSASRSSWR